MPAAMQRAEGASATLDEGKARQAVNLDGPEKTSLVSSMYRDPADPSRGADDPKAPRPRGYKLTTRQRASIRLREFYRLSGFCHAHGVLLEPERWLFVLAATLGAGRPGKAPVFGRQRTFRWHGLTIETLRTAVEWCGLGPMGEDKLTAMIEKVERHQAKHGIRLMSAKHAGELVGLRKEERQECRITTMEAVDETAAERKARKAEERKARDREAKRLIRKGKHTPRSQSLSQIRPWEALGKSRAQWYRDKKRETDLSADNKRPFGSLSSTQLPTNLSHDGSGLGTDRDNQSNAA